MALPLATTTISVLRRSYADEMHADPYDNPEASVTPPAIATGVRAAIGGGTGSQVVAGGVQTTTVFPFACDVTDLVYTDWIKDETTGELYRVEWVQQSGTFLSFLKGQLKQVRGAP